MNYYGLIGFPLDHSFSKTYFENKFRTENIRDTEYHVYPLEDIQGLKKILVGHPELRGLNVTRPHKISVMSHIDEIDENASMVGAVNTLKIYPNGRIKGFNTDVWGFGKTILPLINQGKPKVLILGSGGVSMAVRFVLTKLGIEYTLVSRIASQNGELVYNDLTKEHIEKHQVIINCTPLGSYPHIKTFPAIPYHFLGPEHILYDMVYNPELTEFLRLGQEHNCQTKNGYEMLLEQAEESWRIWNDDTQ